MPHVDELLGITTLASMGLLVALSLQPMNAQGTPAASEEQSGASVRLPHSQCSDATLHGTPDAIDAPPAKPVAAGVAAPIARERT